MKKLTDGELDSFFKNAAEGYQPAFDQASWEVMNARLNEPKPTFWKRWMSFAVVGLLIFSAGIWVGFYINEKASTNVPAEQNGKALFQENKIAIPHEVPSTLKNQDQTAAHEGTDAKDRNTASNQKKRNTELSEKQVHQFITDDQQTENNNVIIISDNTNPADETSHLLRLDTLSVVPDNVSALSLSDSIQNPIEESNVDNTKSDVKQEAKKKEPAITHAFYLRLLASPDFSSINYASANSMGSNYSVLVDYQLTRRWSISTGAIWSMKTYSSDEEFTYGAYTADRMAGDCRILDIPITIYYHFPTQTKTSFYGGLGLSSYIMLEEDYTYTFDTPSGSRDFSSYFESENNEWFKMLNVSIGVQYQFAPRFQVQVEPFLKAPLAGVGEWDVKLSSMGIFMGVKYKIN